MAKPLPSSDEGETKFLKWFQKYLKALPNNTESLARPQQDPDLQPTGVLQNKTSVVTGEPPNPSGIGQEKQTPFPPQSEKKAIVHSGGRNEGSLNPKHEQSLAIADLDQDERYEVLLAGDNIVVSPISKEARKPAGEELIPVADFKKYMSLMNSSTGFQDGHALVNSLLREILVHCSSQGKPNSASSNRRHLPDSDRLSLPSVFNNWTAITDNQSEYYTEYICLPSTSKKLNVILKIPSSLTKLLDDVVKGVQVNLISSSTTHEVTVRIDIFNGSASSSDPSPTGLAASMQTLHINADQAVQYVITDVNALLALIVVLKCYPKKWWEEFFWDAWLAVTIQMHILGNLESLQDTYGSGVKIDVTKAELFPCLWMTTKGVFYAECLVDDPSNVQYLLMGQDPVSMKASLSDMRKATGIAFHNIGDRNPSIMGMSNYKLDCKGNKPEEYCKKRPGLLLVNMIRCIFSDGNSMSGNICKLAWTAYTLKLAHYFGTCNKKYVMVFCKSEYTPHLTDEYLPRVTKKLLQVPHPTKVVEYYKKYEKDEKELKPIWRVQKKLQEFLNDS